PPTLLRGRPDADLPRRPVREPARLPDGLRDRGARPGGARAEHRRPPLRRAAPGRARGAPRRGRRRPHDRAAARPGRGEGIPRGRRDRRGDGRARAADLRGRRGARSGRPPLAPAARRPVPEDAAGRASPGARLPRRPAPRRAGGRGRGRPRTEARRRPARLAGPGRGRRTGRAPRSGRTSAGTRARGRPGAAGLVHAPARRSPRDHGQRPRRARPRTVAEGGGGAGGAAPPQAARRARRPRVGAGRRQGADREPASGAGVTLSTAQSLPLLRWDAPGPYVAAFSTRVGGVSAAPFDTLNLGRLTGDDPEHVTENRARLCAEVGADEDRLAFGRQVHGGRVRRAHGRGEPGDGVWTDEPGRPLLVFTADCVPVALARVNGGRPAIAALHAGWRGLLAGIVAAGAAAVGGGRLTAAIGPGIGPCCYE